MDPKGNFKAPQGATHWYKANGLFYRFADDGNACFDRAHGYQPTGRNLDFYAEGSMLPLVELMISPQNDESQNVARIEWNGEGLPPIGVACQVTPHNDVWGFSTLETRPCSVIAYHADFAWIDLGAPGVPVATRTDKVDFTPIRAPEQIAEAERQAFIDQIIDDSMGRCDIPGAAYLYEAGYRKP